jgi:ubiquinone/menaquinone biosynthesis C-methylase UbiE
MALPRQLEPEVMDTPEEAIAYDDMDHQAVNRAFVSDLLEFQPVADEVLDLGTGTARIPIELCRRDDAVRVVAVDLSLSMLDIARLNLEIAGLVDRILLVHNDSKRLDFPDGRFQYVISNSLLHHLPEPMAALRESVRVTADQGHLFVRDLMRPESGAEVDRLVSRYAGEESERARQLFRESLHAALTLDEIRQMVAQLGFAPETARATSDRHWTWTAQRSAERVH